MVCERQVLGKNIVLESNYAERSMLLKDLLISELTKYCGGLESPNYVDLLSWPNSVSVRWNMLNKVKTKNELGLLSWNVK